MAENNKRRKVRSESMALDAMHIIIGIAVVVMSVISFLDTERYMFLFPVIFFLAAVLNLATGKYWLSRTKRSGGEELRRCSRWDSERSC
ncbi:MAG: DUF6637 family protein [Pilosibacter sp.]